VRARSLAQAGRCLAQIERDMDSAEQMLTEATGLAPDAQVLDLPYGRALVHAHRGRIEAAKAEFAHAADLAHAAADHWREYETLLSLSRLALEERDAATAVRWAARALPVAERLLGGLEPLQARAMLALTQLCAARDAGREDPGCERAFDAACDELNAREGYWRMAQLCILRAELEARHGRLDDAERFARRAATVPRGDAVQLRRGRCQLVLAEIALARGQRAAAREHLAAAAAAPGTLSTPLRARIAQALSGAAPESTIAHTAPPTERA
jgi:hypothetical protein